MNRDDYNKMMKLIEPDAGVENRLSRELTLQKHSRLKRSPVLYMVTSLLVILMLVIVIPEMRKSANQHPVDLTAQTNSIVTTPEPVEITDPNAVVIPKIELPEKTNPLANMVGLVVYNGNIYTQTSTSIAPEFAKSLLGDRLGRTKGNIDEWSKLTDYKELASTIGVTDIYSVKGYDSDFRIMSYQVFDGQVYAELYEQLNGITISTGEDLIGKTHLKDDIESVRWQDYNSWNYSKPEFIPYEMDQKLLTFMTALYQAKPIDGDKLYKEGIYDNGEQNQKVMIFKLRDQTEVILWLFKGNYVKYASAPVFFQLEPEAFSAMWDSL